MQEIKHPNIGYCGYGGWSCGSANLTDKHLKIAWIEQLISDKYWDRQTDIVTYRVAIAARGKVFKIFVLRIEVFKKFGFQNLKSSKIEVFKY